MRYTEWEVVRESVLKGFLYDESVDPDTDLVRRSNTRRGSAGLVIDKDRSALGFLRMLST